LPQLQNFCYRTDADSLFVDIPAAASIRTDEYSVEVSSAYPYDGRIKISCTSGKISRLAVRIPSWCRKFNVPGNGKIENNYWYGSLQAGEDVSFEFDMPVEKIFSRIPSVSGQAAICRGPLVYCVELPYDHEFTPAEVILSDDSKFQLAAADDLPGNCVEIRFNALRLTKPESLYSTVPGKLLDIQVSAIPYAYWQNRQKSEMVIFMPYYLKK
jgi:DUF1680 family protein